MLIIAGSAYIWWAGKPPNRETSKEDKNETVMVPTTAITLTEDSSPNDTDGQNVEAPQTNHGIDFQDPGDFRQGPAQNYPGTPAEKLKNKNYRMHVGRYDDARRRSSRDSSPHPPLRENSITDNEVAGSPTSPSRNTARRTLTLEVPPTVYSSRGRSASNAL